MQSKRSKEFIHHILWAGRCSPSPGEQGSFTHNGDLGRKALWIPPSSPFFPQLYMLMLYMHRVPWAQLGSAVPPPKCWCTPSLLTAGVGRRAEQAVALCKLCPAVSETSLYHQYWYQHKSKTTAPFQLLQRKLTPSQWKPAHLSMKSCSSVWKTVE